MRKRYADKLAYIVKTAPSSRQLKDPFEALYAAGLALEPPLPPERLLILAEENAVHAACLKAKVDDTVGRGWFIEGGAEEDTEKLAELLEELTPDWTFAELLSAAVWELEAIGWAAWEIVRDGSGRIAAIYPMPAHTVRMTQEPSRLVQIRGALRREFALFGTDHEPDVSEVILFRTYTPRSAYYGIPRWVSAIPAIAELTAIREYNVSWFASGGTVDRLITVSSPTITEAQQIADEVREVLRDSAGRGHVSIVTAMSSDSGIGVQFLSPQVNRREGQFIRRREDLVKEVLMAHGVPPYRIGWAELGSLGGSAAREMLRAYKVGVVEPLQTILEARLNQTLFGPKGLNITGRWRLRDLDWEETELNLELATKGVQHGLMTPNEARQLLGLDPVEDPDLDEFYIAQNLKPLGASEVEERGAVQVLEDLKQTLESSLGVIS